MFLLTIYFLVFLFLTYRIGRAYFSDVSSLAIPVIFVIRCGLALFFLYVYTYHYGGGELTADAGRFFTEAQQMKAVFHQNSSDFFQLMFGIENNNELAAQYLDKGHHWFADYNFTPMDSRNVVRANTLLLFLSNGEILIHFLFFTFIALLGVLDISHWLIKQLSLPKKWIVIIACLIPGVAFWSSSILKEPLLLFGFSIVLRAVFDNSLAFRHASLRYTIGIPLMLLFKPYVLMILAPFILYKWVVAPWFKTTFWKGVIIYAGASFIFLLISGLGSLFVNSISTQQLKFINIKQGGLYLKAPDAAHYYVLYENSNHFIIDNNTATLAKPTKALKVKNNQDRQHNTVQLENIGQEYPVIAFLTVPGSGIDITPIFGSSTTMITMIPEVLFNTLIRPLPSDKGSWLKYLAFAENILVAICVLLSFIFFRRTLNLEEKIIVFCLLGFSLSLFLIVGWTTPVLGASVRYKVPALLTLIMATLFILDWEKIKRVGF